jgi:CheY-like chemotaxis protein
MATGILVIEDDEGIREMLRQVLELYGYIVFTASDGEKGIERLRSDSLFPCLILLDLMMPVMDGWEFMEAFHQRKEWSSIPVVVVSAFADKAADLHAQGLLAKPLVLDNLLAVVERYCGKN